MVKIGQNWLAKFCNRPFVMVGGGGSLYPSRPGPRARVRGRSAVFASSADQHGRSHHRGLVSPRPSSHRKTVQPVGVWHVFPHFEKWRNTYVSVNFMEGNPIPIERLVGPGTDFWALSHAEQRELYAKSKDHDDSILVHLPDEDGPSASQVVGGAGQGRAQGIWRRVGDGCRRNPRPGSTTTVTRLSNTMAFITSINRSARFANPLQPPSRLRRDLKAPSGVSPLLLQGHFATLRAPHNTVQPHSAAHFMHPRPSLTAGTTAAFRLSRCRQNGLHVSHRQNDITLSTSLPPLRASEQFPGHPAPDTPLPSGRGSGSH